MKYLSLGAIIKDDEYYVREWLTFYDMIGVEHFYIALHNCSDNTESAIKSLPFRDRISLYRVQPTTDRNPQVGTYQAIIDQCKNETEWLMFVDGDEFLFGTEKDDLKEILPAYEAFSSICVNWLMFGANKFATRPPMPSIKHYTQRLPITTPYEKQIRDELDSYLVKSIVKPSEVTGIVSPHLFRTKNGTVNEQFLIVKPYEEGNGLCHCKHPPSYDVLRCNHYYTRSYEDWLQRLKRGANNPLHYKRTYNEEHFRKYQHGIRDFTIQRFVPELEERLLGDAHGIRIISERQEWIPATTQNTQFFSAAISNHVDHRSP